MLTLASMVYAAYAYVAASMHMESKVVPQPVTVEHGCCYSYNIYEDAIYVPDDWNDKCENQRMIVYEMAVHFNNFLSYHKFPDSKMKELSAKWVCLTDDKK